MKANEFRIGNLVERDGNILEVIRVAKDGIVNYDLVRKSQGMHVNSGNVIPIPLTEEWLLKFGFEKIDRRINETYEKDLGAFYFQIILMNDDKSYNVRFSNDTFKEEGDRVGLGLIYYVHQLQNLFFVLTGEELKINL